MPTVTLDRTDIATFRDAIVRLHRRMRRHAATELTPSQMSALTTLHRHGGMRIGDLARRELIGKSSVTRLVSRLEDAGYLDRRPDPDDARSAQVELNARGRQVVVDYNEQAADYLARQIDALSESDRQILLTALPVLGQLVRGKS